MVHVRLARDWTDGTGADHDAGDLVDVDAVTLAELEATGVVAGHDQTGHDQTGHGGPGHDSPQWVNPTGGEL